MRLKGLLLMTAEKSYVTNFTSAIECHHDHVYAQVSHLHALFRNFTN